ncbi:MAG TPA: GGDEF domain-containing protein [Burkholderiaceae bacterium]
MGLLRSASDALLTRDRRQRFRLAQAWLACLLLFCCILALHLADRLGLVERGPLWWWSGASLAGMFVVIGLIRSGLNRDLRDPALTMLQMLYSVLCAGWAYSFAGGAHGMVGIILAVILMFGMFGLSIRQILFTAAYVLLLFGGVMAWKSRADPAYPPGLELNYFVMLCIMVTGVALLTTRLHRMRDRLHRQKMELEAALAHIQRLATHDELTGLVNRRHMQVLLENERLRSERTTQDWCLALIDLDHFKAVNDRHGHAIGDEALRALGRHAHALIRKTDVLARWGGEEFVLLLPNTPLAMAVNSLERLREHVAAQPLTLSDGVLLPMSFSAGVTEYRRGETFAQTLERADRLCYRAKELGRNRVERG